MCSKWVSAVAGLIDAAFPAEEAQADRVPTPLLCI
jgi:hypothetical protein